MDSTDMWIGGIFFIATFIRSALGFGEALIAVPLAAFLLPVDVAAPVAVLVSIVIAGVVVAQDWRDIHFKSASWLVVYTLFGIPAGLYLLVTMPEAIVKGVLAVFMIAFALYSLLGRKQWHGKGGGATWLFGFTAGVFGGAYGMNGPPLVIYGVLQGWTPQQFRATLQGYFLPASLVGMAGYYVTGLWTPQVTHYFTVAFVPVLLAIFLGRWVNQRMDGAGFLRYVYVGLIAIGVTLLL